MDENESVDPDLQRTTEGLESGLQSCQQIVADYRSALLNLTAQTEPPNPAPDEISES